VFFALTKLFLSQDVVLRRMVYLALKELSPYAQDMIIIVSSLTKDMNSDIGTYRANSIRVLCKILNDFALLGQGERYLRQAIVDRDPYVGSAALVSGVHMMNSNQSNADIVRRWISEITEATKSKFSMVQYHALGLLYQIKQHDRLAVSKLVATMSRSVVRSPYAHCLLIRFAAQVLSEQAAQGKGVNDSSAIKGLFDYLVSSLRHKQDMVIYEAARAIVDLDNAPQSALSAAISVIQLFLTTPKSTLRFAAIRTLNRVSIKHATLVQTCNEQMERLIDDSNRAIATLAITTLLQTGTLESIDRLIRQITTFMGDISDEFKVVVVKAIRQLGIKFSREYKTWMNFLSEVLRDEGGFELKKAVVDTIITLIEQVPASKETGLSHLCEFIEDCEFTQLSTLILTVLGREGPYTSCASKFIRYVYNRVILENTSIRTAAVSTLGRFALAQPPLRKNIVVLLQRCLFDNDDEVRDRATYYLSLLKVGDKGIEIGAQQGVGGGVPLVNLESALLSYLSNIKESADQPFDITSVSMKPPFDPHAASAASSSSTGAASASASSSGSSYEHALAAIPAFQAYGKLFCSSSPVQLTEPETEYGVSCVKHTFPEHFVFQFNITNTLKEQLLENVQVVMQPSSDLKSHVAFECAVPAASVGFSLSAPSYTVFKRISSDALMPVGTFKTHLDFTLKEVDPMTQELIDDDDEGFPDEYEIDEIDLSAGDYILATQSPNFPATWEKLDNPEAQVAGTFNLSSMSTIEEAVKQVSAFLGMAPCDRSGEVHPNQQKHILYLSGIFLGLGPVVAQVRIRVPPSGSGIDMQLTVRSKHPKLSQTICNLIA